MKILHLEDAAFLLTNKKISIPFHSIERTREDWSHEPAPLNSSLVKGLACETILKEGSVYVLILTHSSSSMWHLIGRAVGSKK